MILSIILLVGLFQSPSTTHPTSKTVLEVDQRFNAAIVRKDEAEVSSMLADDLLYISFDGQMATKSEFMTFFKNGVWRYVKYEPSKVTVKVFNDVAVITGRVDRVIVIEDEETRGAFAFTRVWVRSGDRWRLTSSQVSNIPN
jgi:ketosteroid isomerase-like protein